MSKLEKELDAYAIPGMSAAEEREKGPSDKTKAKVEKVYGRGKQAVDAGGAVVGAGIRRPSSARRPARRRPRPRKTP